MTLLDFGEAVGRAKDIKTQAAAMAAQRTDPQVLAHGQLREQLVDLIALGQSVLIGGGDIGGSDVEPVQKDSPESGISSRVSKRRSVLLPAPLGPMMA